MSTTAPLSTVTNFLTPPSLWLADAAKGTATEILSQPAKFDASDLVAEQREAVSSDGTKIPYFLVHRKDIKLDGNNPTLLYAYGGFEVSETPNYSATNGKLWLEKGGVYALANIRGGGEFGPAWHEAGLGDQAADHLRRLRRGRARPHRHARSPARAGSASTAAPMAAC